MDKRELQELVDAPAGERLDVEYKSWLDLSDRRHKAALARHFAALANHGGGFLVFGINDDMTTSGPRPPEAGPYDQDALSAIVKRYLAPAFHVRVAEVESANSGVAHPVVGIPSHGAKPCAACAPAPRSTGRASGSRRARTTREPWVPSRSRS